jgi:hypothetical protein
MNNVIEFWGSFWGGWIGIIVVWTTIFWYGTLRENKSETLRYVSIILSVIVINLYGEVHYGIPSRHEGILDGQKEVSGLPISSQLQGHTFTPLAFTITEHRILFTTKMKKSMP